MYFLKNYLTDNAKQILTGLSYDDNQYEHAEKLLSTPYRQPHIIKNSQLKLVQKFPIVRKHDSHQTSKSAGVVSTFVSILISFGFKMI